MNGEIKFVVEGLAQLWCAVLILKSRIFLAFNLRKFRSWGYTRVYIYFSNGI